ncbi:helix-turn-helix domain-containing protein [Salinibacillus xinjiangensis]|nr:helix-turn-helix domain-containing protein [Salinibacillus xinjiangensis]
MLISGNIGEKIKDLRQYFGISQKAVCEGICSQAYISRLEKGEINVSADILFLLSRRLGVDINYFFENYNSPRSEYVMTTMREVRDAINKRDYEHADEIVSLELKNPLFKKNIEGEQFLLWHKGICMFELGKGVDEALFYIDRALDCCLTTNKNYSEREIEIFLAKAIILHSTKKLTDSKRIYNELTTALNKNVYITDPKIFVRSFYNYSRLLVDMNEYSEATQKAKQGIQYANKNGLLYLQGELYFQLARTYEHMEKLNLAIENYKTAKSCFALIDDYKPFEVSNKKVEEIEEMLNH